MPFIQRIVEPKFLSRTSLYNDDGEPIVSDYELEAITNNTLSNALRQLASLVLVANDIFSDLTQELKKVSTRAAGLKTKIALVEKKVEEYDPKQVAVPEGDLSTFALLTSHYGTKQPLDTGLFTPDSRPKALKVLYETAAKTPVHVMRQMDRWRRDGHRSSRFFLCTPVLGQRKKMKIRVDYDIETRMPASVEELRRWTSTEALGDVTVTTDCVPRITNITQETEVTDGATSDDDGIDHKLPSPEEQLQVIALKFPAEIVAVDVSGRRFDRMSTQRRSLLRPETYNTEEDQGDSTIRRRTRTRKPRGKRRNTLAGTDQKEIVDALTARDEPTTSITNEQTPESTPARSRSSDLLRSNKKSPPDSIRAHFNSLKQWGKNKLKSINKSAEKEVEHTRTEDIDDINIYETVSMRKWKHDKNIKSTHERKTSYSSSEKSSSISLPIATPVPPAVKLRDSSAQTRQRRNGTKEEQHSSSGNWSASSESGRASIGSEITTTTQPKSTTSAATSSNSLNQHLTPSVNSRRKFINTSASSSVTSEGTLTPDIHDNNDDGETSSVYSCDTEGYYTSFHMDSGLKTLKEEDSSLPATPLHSTTAFSNSSTNCTVLSAENEYELFGKGSTSTTTSSAGTVCTTLMAADSSKSLSIGPVVPERKSSLSCNSRSPSSSLERDFGSDKTGTVKRSPADSNKETVTALVHGNGDISPDSGHNTSSSPIESVSSPNGAPSGSEFEFSESSDLEGVDRIERIRIKTTINSSRIPSMCVITPPQSDDESISSECDRKAIGSKNIDRDRLNLNLQPTETDLDTIIFNDNKDKEVLDNKIEQNSNKLVMKNPPLYMTPEPVKPPVKSSPPQTVFKATLLPLNNMFGKLKTNISNLTSRKSPGKPQSDVDDSLFDSGDYVTIADVRNNNEKAAKVAETHYANDIKVRETEYVCLQELPTPEDGESKSLERRKGARVTLDAEGKVVYSSDSLKRRKGGHSTFEPGPCVKDPVTASPLPARTTKIIRPVNIQDNRGVTNTGGDSRPLSPQMNKFVIRANPKTSGVVTPIVRMLPTTIVSPSIRPMSPKLNTSVRGAYVNMQDNIDSSKYEEERGLYASYSPHIDQRSPEVYMQRGGVYSTLPTRRPPKIEEDPYRRYSPQPNYPDGYSSLPRRQIYPREQEIHQLPKYQVPSRNQFVNFQSSTPNKEPTNTKIPMGISNFFSPINKPQRDDSFKISPIEPCNSGKFQSSTPHKPVNSAVNLSNKLLSPKKSTMSNEELYAVIHRSKKKLNIKADFMHPEPVTTIEPSNKPESGYFKPQTRSSWSPNNEEIKNTELDRPGSRQSWACNDRLGNKKQTSRLDFKKLLLQQNSKTPVQTKKLSAVEQLKLSKEQPKKPQSPIQITDLSASPKSLGKKFNGPIEPTSPERKQKIMSPRSAWRFASPRSDVLSSTILEDCREDENSSNEKISPKQSSVAYSNTVADKFPPKITTFTNSRNEFPDRASMVPVSSPNWQNSARNQFFANQFVPNEYSDKFVPNVIHAEFKAKQDEFKVNRPEGFRSQYIQARRDAYFNVQSSSSVQNIKRESPPTLETAL